MNTESNKPYGDLILIQNTKDVNVSDAEEIIPEVKAERTQTFTKINSKRSVGLFYRIYSFFSVIAVAIALVFSASMITDLIFGDSQGSEMTLSRILGQAVTDIAEKKSLTEIIMNQSFFDLSIKKSDKTYPPATDGSNSINKPSSTTQKVEGGNQTPTLPPLSESTPPKSEGSSPSTTPVEPPSENALPILTMDLSYVIYGKNYIYNDTSIKLSLDSIRESSLTNRYIENSSEPLVLVIHTHTTESYMPDGATYYENVGEIARSHDPEENMIAVGIEFVRVLEENGIPTLHCTIIHDAESYRESYQRSAETINKYLAEHPSIQYVFDLHRDSIVKSSGELVRAVSSIDGQSHAQIMPVVSGGFEGYEENLTFALRLRDLLNAHYANVCRPVCLRESLYNQNLAPASILLEIGTSGCSLTEAKTGAALAAEAVAVLIKSAG